nr:LOW QUALITY PROTEIN: uncharacterized protein I203_03909 [Kwoniella mangroviensis CBS 8507]OCF67222.1 LOW QUALITY PROTEIN: hypothetical protein I203_03909 [Kwoniella mangroviensis CBS 8507]
MPFRNSSKLTQSLSDLSSRASDLELENQELKQRLRALEALRVSEWQKNRHIITNLESKHSNLLDVYTEDKFTLTNNKQAYGRHCHGSNGIYQNPESGWSMIDNLLKDHFKQEDKVSNILMTDQDTKNQVESFVIDTLREHYTSTMKSGYGEYPNTMGSKLDTKAKARMASSLRDPHIFALSIQLGDGDDIDPQVVKSHLRVGPLPVDDIIRETIFTK